jgi:hypothetical protein
MWGTYVQTRKKIGRSHQTRSQSLQDLEYGSSTWDGLASAETMPFWRQQAVLANTRSSEAAKYVCESIKPNRKRANKHSRQPRSDLGPCSGLPSWKICKAAAMVPGISREGSLAPSHTRSQPAEDWCQEGIIYLHKQSERREGGSV